MEKCWNFTPEDRIDIFEAVKLLRLAKEEYREKTMKGQRNEKDQDHRAALSDGGNAVTVAT